MQGKLLLSLQQHFFPSSNRISCLSFQVRTFNIAPQSQSNSTEGVSRPTGCFASINEGDKIQYQQPFLRQHWRGVQFCPHKTEVIYSVWEQCVTAEGLKKKIHEQKKSYVQAHGLLKMFHSTFLSRTSWSVHFYFKNNLSDRKWWGKSWLDQNYNPISWKYLFCIST